VLLVLVVAGISVPSPSSSSFLQEVVNVMSTVVCVCSKSVECESHSAKVAIGRYSVRTSGNQRNGCLV